MREFDLVIPCYNEEKNISILLDRSVQAAQAAGCTPANFQLMVVQNGSKDNSAEILQKIKKTPLGDWFQIIDIPQNQGYGYGVFQGLKNCEAAYIGWMHADLQCDPRDAFRALQIAKEAEQSLIVKGVRKGRDWKERLVSRIFEAIGRVLLGLKSHEVNAQPKVFRRKTLELLEDPPRDFAFDLYFLFKAQKNKIPLREIEVLFPARIHGVSHWASTYASRYKTMWNMVKYMLRLLWLEGRA